MRYFKIDLLIIKPEPIDVVIVYVVEMNPRIDNSKAANKRLYYEEFCIKIKKFGLVGAV